MTFNQDLIAFRYDVIGDLLCRGWVARSHAGGDRNGGQFKYDNDQSDAIEDANAGTAGQRDPAVLLLRASHYQVKVN